MRILLLSRNRVVQELVKLGVREIEGAYLEIVDRLEAPDAGRYDLILEEDRFVNGAEEIGIDYLLAGRRILLGDPSGVSERSRFDAVIPKPFLPSDIQKVLRQEAGEEFSPERGSIREFLEEEGVSMDEEETEILDEAEIRRIRRLLEGEIEESAARMEIEPSEQRIDAETFLELIERFRGKKLRKILRGATIRISIEFPEEEER